MENMDKGLTLSKWVLIDCSKTSQTSQNLSAQIVWPSPYFGISMKKGFIWRPYSVAQYIANISLHVQLN